MNKVINMIAEKKWYIIATILFFILEIFLNNPFQDEISNKIRFVHIAIWTLLFFASIFFIIFILKKEADEKTFLKMAVLLGVFFIVLTPVCHQWDESSHLFRAFMISQGNFYDQLDEYGNIGGYVPENYAKFLNNGSITIKKILFDYSSLTESFSEEKAFFPLAYFSSTIPTGHTIPALGIWIGRLLNAGFIPTVLLGRLFSYIFYVTCSYLAIKNMKYYKSIMFMIVTIPISFLIAGSISLDPIINSSCFLFVSICLKYYFNDDENLKLSKKDIALIFFTAVMILTNKYLVFAPLLLLFFIIPRKCFSDKKQYALIIFFAFIIGLLCVLWQLKLLNMFEYQEDRNGNVNQKQQVEYILSNISSSTRTIINAIQERGIIYLNKFTNLSAVTVIGKSIGFIIFVGAMLERNKLIEKQKKKKLSIITFLLYIIIFPLSLLALYLSFTPVGDTVVQGYQTRYLVPMLILLLIPVANITNVQNNIKDYERKIVYFMFIANIDIILGILINSFKI